MTTPWQVQDAKQHFSELLRASHSQPQVVTRHGREVAVVVDIEEYRRLTGNRLEFSEFLRHGPTFDELDLERNPELTRTVDRAPDA